MAAFAHVRNMNDHALRPRLLKRILKEDVLAVKRPLGNSAQLSKVISDVRTYSLLTESTGNGSADQKLLADWKTSVDSWMECVLQLVSNDMPDKCWAGICLLGLTCSECSTNRFLRSYSIWFQALLKQIQLPKDSHFVKVALCAAMSDLLARLGKFPNVKKDVTAMAATVVQPVLKLLSDDQSEAILDVAVHLLSTIVEFYPSSVSRHYGSVECAIASKLLSENCSLDMSKKLGYVLALLPQSKGDEGSWILLMQKILQRINNHLNDAFQGFEDDYKSQEAMRLLIRPGKDLPPPFGEQISSEEPPSTKKRPETLTTSSVSALMFSCCEMLTSPYPVQVSIPVRSLLFLVERVLMVNASSPDSQRHFVTSMQQTLIASELPALHQSSLELLAAIITSVRSQLLPHMQFIVRLISVYFKKCALPELRTKMYAIIKTLFIEMRTAMVSNLAQEVLDNAFIDLNPAGFRDGGTNLSVATKPLIHILQSTSTRKRKQSNTPAAPETVLAEISLNVGAQMNDTPKLISLRIAALEAVEVLVTVGGDLRAEGWRSQIDLLLINIAKNSFNEGWANDKRSIFEGTEASATRANLQIVALHTLLASFQSSRVRSSYIGQGLELFSQGKRATGSKLSEFCARALLAMEVLLHPRTLQADDFPVETRFPDEVNHKSAENNFPGPLGTGHSVHDLDQDVLYDNWLENGREPEATVSDPIEKPSEASLAGQDVKITDNDADTLSADLEMRGEEKAVFDRLIQNPATTTTYDGSARAENASERIVLDTGLSKDSKPECDSLALEDAKKYDGKLSSASSIHDKGKELLSDWRYDDDSDDSDMDDLPEIVMTDPDSDYEGFTVELH